MSAAVKTVSEGKPGSLDFRLRFECQRTGETVSPWHDIPLVAGEGLVNAVIEIPKMTRAKMEVATKEAQNAIAQDVKKGQPRSYHGPIFWNYGMLPQTWENPHHEESETRCFGDNDPLDVVEIGSKPLALGSVEPVKPLGILAMIDDGELDWKVIAVSAKDPLAEKLSDIADVERHCPGTISGIREWFRWYKTPDGKSLNRFGFGEAALSRDKALEVIEETHAAWQDLRAGRFPKQELWVPSAQKGHGLQTMAVSAQSGLKALRSKL